MLIGVPGHFAVARLFVVATLFEMNATVVVDPVVDVGAVTAERGGEALFFIRIGL